MRGLAINGSQPVTDFRAQTYWRGAMILELELDLDPSAPLPSGTVTVNVFDQDVVATVDAPASSRFADRAIVRVVGGKNGWNDLVTARDFANDDGVDVDTIIRATAADVGETIAETPSLRIGKNYPRSAGVASRVLAGLDWYVDFQGQTHVASRPLVSPPADAEVLAYDPLTRTLTIGTLDSLIVPGMQFIDTFGRWSGTLTVRDVEQRFTADGESVATAFCGTDTSSQSARELLDRFVAESVRLPYLKSYRYRIVAQDDDGRLELQALEKIPGLPDVLPLEVWTGVQGATAKYSALDGAIVSITFIEGYGPVVIGHDPSFVPLEIHLDAQTLIALGKNNLQFVALENKVKANFDAFNDALVTTGLPVAGGGGGRAKLASPVVLEAMGSPLVKAEGP